MDPVCYRRGAAVALCSGRVPEPVEGLVVAKARDKTSGGRVLALVEVNVRGPILVQDVDTCESDACSGLTIVLEERSLLNEKYPVVPRLSQTVNQDVQLVVPVCSHCGG